MAAQTNRFDCTALPKGWQREEVVRKHGLFAGKIDVFYYSPDGRKIRSKVQLVRCMEDDLDLRSFDYRTGKFKNIQLCEQKKQRRSRYDNSRGAHKNAPLVPLMPKMPSIQRLPVLKIQESRLNTDFLIHGRLDKPKQLLWEEQVEGLDTDGHELRAMDLSTNFKAVGPLLKEETIPVATEFDMSKLPIVDQAALTSSLDNNSGIINNSDQSLLQLFWEEQLEGLDTDGHELRAMDLSTNFKAVGPLLTEGTIPVATALDESTLPIVDLTASTSSLDNNSGILNNSDQSLLQNQFAISQERTVSRQQLKVETPKQTSIIDLTNDTDDDILVQNKERSVGRQKLKVETPTQTSIIDLTEESTLVPNTNIATIFTCQFCNRVFSTLDVFNQHMMTHDVANLPYKCILCFTEYPTKQLLHRHRIIYHEVLANEEMYIPIVDLDQKEILQKLSRLGIKHYIPLFPPNREAKRRFGLPIVDAGNAYNSAVCKLRRLGASNVFSMGTTKAIGK